MAAAYVLCRMGSTTVPFLSDLYAANELYFILFALTMGFLVAQLFIWQYNKGRLWWGIQYQYNLENEE